jgi:hypothetical protein
VGEPRGNLVVDREHDELGDERIEREGLPEASTTRPSSARITPEFSTWGATSG